MQVSKIENRREGAIYILYLQMYTSCDVRYISTVSWCMNQHREINLGLLQAIGHYRSWVTIGHGSL